MFRFLSLALFLILTTTRVFAYTPEIVIGNWEGLSNKSDVVEIGKDRVSIHDVHAECRYKSVGTINGKIIKMNLNCISEAGKSIASVLLIRFSTPREIEIRYFDLGDWIKYRRVVSLPSYVGQCVDTEIIQTSDLSGERLKPPSHKFKSGFDDPGTAVMFANGGSQATYNQELPIVRSKTGDKVKMCLTELPKECPKGQKGARIYKTTNNRTKEQWELADSELSCQ